MKIFTEEKVDGNLKTTFFSVKKLSLDEKNVVATIGNFDGVHKGHRSVLKRVVDAAKASDGLSVVVTFSPHPTKFFFPEKAKEQLMTEQQKIEELLKFGIDCVVLVEFNLWLSQLSASDFCEKILFDFLRVEKLYVGYDFHFGKGREGNFEFLKKKFLACGKVVEQTSSVIHSKEQAISSSLIRDLIKKGDVSAANELLGRYFTLSGTIVHGDAKGREIGFPTANLRWENELTPAVGVYACFVEFEGRKELLPGVLNCGFRPILGHDLALQIEAYIFDFSENVYDLSCKFHFVTFLRNELPYTNWDDLKKQIELDCENAKRILEQKNLPGKVDKNI